MTLSIVSSELQVVLIGQKRVQLVKNFSDIRFEPYFEDWKVV